MQKNSRKIIILSIIIIVSMLTIRIFSNPLVAGDEFINYYNTLKIFNGEKMWEEVNIITTPFIYLLGMAFFKIFGTKLYIYRLCNLIINLIFLLTIYKIFRNLKINKIPSLIYTSILEILMVSYVVNWGVTYNLVAITFCLIGINLSIKRKEIKYYNILQGFIIFLVFFTKHNIGLYYAISQIIIEFLIGEKNKKIINLIKQFFIVLIGISFFIITLYYSNLMNSFVDLSFKRFR